MLWWWPITGMDTSLCLILAGRENSRSRSETKVGLSRTASMSRAGVSGATWWDASFRVRHCIGRQDTQSLDKLVQRQLSNWRFAYHVCRLGHAFPGTL